MAKPIVLSGIQPTGNLHVGNYLGAVKNWVDLQNSGKYDCYFCIVDYHSLTGNMDAKTRAAQTMRTAAELLAAGIDPQKSTLFVQSHVPECTELAWIFNCVTPITELYRMTQFKDKSERQEKNINAGLLTYPILQAADILLYRGQFVPVGLDQVQHIELTRDIARWFNKRFGEFFPETKPLLTEIPKVMSLLAPDKKMSKSLGEGHVIEMADEKDVLEKKIKKAVTATTGGEKAEGVENLFLLLKHFGDATVYKELRASEKDGTIQYGNLKNVLIDALDTYFSSFRAERAKLLKQEKTIESALAEGAKKAGAVAENTMEKVRSLVGLR